MVNFFSEAPANRSASWHSTPDFRGSYDILSSCAVTLFLCIWTAVHLNIPEHDTKPKTSKWNPRDWITATRLRKAGWLVLGMLAPELIAFTAWVQRRQAHQLTKRIRNALGSKKTQGSEDIEIGLSQNQTSLETSKSIRQHRWTDVHSFFVLSGGFAVDTSNLQESEQYLPGPRRQVTLNPETVFWIAQVKPTLLPDVSKEAIEDKSKASGIVKGFVCVQATWFIIQCIYRLFSPGLSISLLELNTFAHSICMLLIYIFWWNKPQDVMEPIIITDIRIHPLCAMLCLTSRFGGRSDISKMKAPRNKYQLKNLVRRVLPDVNVDSDDALRRALRSFTSDIPTKESTVQELQPFQRIPGTILYAEIDSTPIHCIPRDQRRWNLACEGIIQYETVPHDIINPICDRIRNFPTGFNWASSMQPTTWLEPPSDGVVLLIGGSIAGSMYGGLHLFAWNAPFTSDIQKLLWRVSSVTVAASGLFLLSMRLLADLLLVIWLLIFALEYASRRSWASSVSVWRVSLALNFPLALFYLFARIFLVTECFVSFAYLPDSAFKQASWSEFFSHVQ